MKLKFDVSGVESSQDLVPVKPGMVIAKIDQINETEKQHGPLLEIVFKVVSDSKGNKKIEGVGSNLWTYIYTDYEPQAFRLREFLEAVGVVEKGQKKAKGQVDLDKLIGKEIQIRVKMGQNLEGDYKPVVGKMLSLAAAEAVGEDDEEEEPDEEELEEETEEDEDEEEVDLDEMSRAELKAFIEQEDLNVKVTKKMSEDDIRKAIAAAMPEPDEEEEEEEDEEDEDTEIDFTEFSRAELKKYIKDNELDVTVRKADNDDTIISKIQEAMAEDDEEEEDEEEDETPDYNSWDTDQLKTELKERGLEIDGKFSKKKAVTTLKNDDESDDEPF